MTVSELIAYLHSLGIKLWYEGEQLRIKGPKDNLTPELRQEMLARKTEVLAFLQEANAMREVHSEPLLLPVARNGKLPTSLSQESLWFLDQLEPGNTTYNLSLALRLRGSLNLKVLEQTFCEIVRRHETLRTTFYVENGQPYQRISAPGTFKLPLIDLRKLPEAERENEVRRLITEQELQPFDLAEGPLFRTTLLQLTNADHYLLVTMHHTISDGWSLGIFYQEFQVLYENYLEGKPSPLPELPIQFADFAHWQRQWLQGGVLETQLAYWKKQLGGDFDITELPFGSPRPAPQTYKGSGRHFTLPPALLSRIKELSNQEGTTLFMVLLGAFKILLSRYTNHTDVIVGSPIANRNRVETEKLIGYFINNLILRTDLSGDPSFRESLARVRETTLGAYANQDIPFIELVKALQPNRAAGPTSIFKIMFSFHNEPSTEIRIPGLLFQPLKSEIRMSMFDLTLDGWEQVEGTENYPEGLNFILEYKTELFDSTTISQMAVHFETLLEGIVANPDQNISQLPLMTNIERQQLLKDWNKTQVEYSNYNCIHQLFETQVLLTPNAYAVQSGNECLTYYELNSRANQVAHYLQKLGVDPETLVGIFMERSLEMIIGLLGVLKAGGAYLPLDPAYPEERREFMLKDSQARVLITTNSLTAALPQASAQVVCLDTDWHRISQESEENLVTSVKPTNLAYVIYTSGSTGKPKGVMIQHNSLVNYSEMICAKFKLKADDSVLQFASISFDASAEEIYPTLISGAKLILRSDSMLGTMPIFLNTCRDLGVTILDLPTAYWHQLTAEMIVQNLSLPESIRIVVIGGERALPERVSAWINHVGRQVQLLNSYGPTEATIAATFFDLTKFNPDLVTNEVPIGKPIQNMQAYVLDRNDQPMPIGIPGELHLGGVGLARGYLNQPELTDKKFIASPFSNEKDAKLYKTGDLARYLSDGNIEYLGRIDHQVKIRGFRIELGEIEVVLRQHPMVNDALAAVHEEKTATKQIVAYVVLQKEHETVTSILRNYLKEHLPDFMIPSTIMILDAFPITPGGKVDRKALPKPEITREDLEESYLAPETQTEKKVAEIWKNVLDVKKIGVDDNFFELGGHSLLAIQVVSLINDAFGVNSLLSHLFERPTVAGLSELIDTMQWALQSRQTTTGVTMVSGEVGEI